MAVGVGVPVRIVTTLGEPVVRVAASVPAQGRPGVVVTDNRGNPIVLVSTLGTPMVLWNEDGTEHVPA